MKTTLNAIRSHSPCSDGWSKLIANLGKTRPDDDPLPILTVLKSNGLDDALWALRAVEGCDREIRLLAVWFARQVQHLMTDQRSLEAMDVAERLANGNSDDYDELSAAEASAWAAAEDAAEDAAEYAEEAAAEAAARAAAWAVSGAAARAVSGAAARAAAGTSAWAAARAAAGAAARAAEEAAERLANGNSDDDDDDYDELSAAEASAWAAAWDAAQAAQKTKLIEICEACQ